MSKFEIKSLKFFVGDEGQGFNCDLFIDGVKVYHIRDNADGGEFRWDMYDGIKERRLAYDLKKMIQKMPEKDFGDFKCKMTMDIFLEELVISFQKQQLNNKLLKLEENHIIWGIAGGDSYTHMKMNRPLDFYDHKQLQNYLKTKIIPLLKKGETIWNRNLVSLEYKLTK